MTHVEDVIEANVKAMNKLLTNPELISGQTLNIGTGKNYTIKELADMIIQSLRKDGFAKTSLPTYLPPRPAEAKETLADITLAKQLLNWEPKFSLSEGIEKLKPFYIKKWKTKKENK